MIDQKKLICEVLTRWLDEFFYNYSILYELFLDGISTSCARVRVYLFLPNYFCFEYCYISSFFFEHKILLFLSLLNLGVKDSEENKRKKNDNTEEHWQSYDKEVVRSDVWLVFSFALFFSFTFSSLFFISPSPCIKMYFFYTWK